MNDAARFETDVASFATQPPFAEAQLSFQDGSRLFFCHRVGERWARALGRQDADLDHGSAGRWLQAMALFRLNAKHLDLQFKDGSRWERKPEG